MRPLRFNWFSSLDEVRRARKRFDPARPSHWVAGSVVALIIGIVLSNLVFTAYLIASGQAAATELSNTQLVAALVVNMVFFIGAPLLWVQVMYYGGLRAVRERLLLHSERPVLDSLIGVGLGVFGLILSIAAVLLFQVLGLETDNPVVENLGDQLTWSMVLFIPFAAATSEEVFFRSFLQPRIGLVGANVFFGFVHLSYATPLQVVVPMLLGFVLGLAMLRRRSVLPAVVGHFVFNLVALVVAKLESDYGLSGGIVGLF